MQADTEEQPEDKTERTDDSGAGIRGVRGQEKAERTTSPRPQSLSSPRVPSPGAKGSSGIELFAHSLLEDRKLNPWAWNEKFYQLKEASQGKTDLQSIKEVLLKFQDTATYYGKLLVEEAGSAVSPETLGGRFKPQRVRLVSGGALLSFLIHGIVFTLILNKDEFVPPSPADSKLTIGDVLSLSSRVFTTASYLMQLSSKLRIPLQLLLDYRGQRVFAVAETRWELTAGALGISAPLFSLLPVSLIEPFVLSYLNLAISESSSSEQCRLEDPEGYLTPTQLLACLPTEENRGDRWKNVYLPPGKSSAQPRGGERSAHEAKEGSLEIARRAKRRLRPEMVIRFLEFKQAADFGLRSDGFTALRISPSEATRYLTDSVMPKFVEHLLSLDVNLTERDLTFEFHQFGVSLRHLGYIRLLCGHSPIVSQLLFSEMLSRTLKRLLRRKFRILAKKRGRGLSRRKVSPPAETSSEPLSTTRMEVRTKANGTSGVGPAGEDSEEGASGPFLWDSLLREETTKFLNSVMHPTEEDLASLWDIDLVDEMQNRYGAFAVESSRVRRLAEGITVKVVRRLLSLMNIKLSASASEALASNRKIYFYSVDIEMIVPVIRNLAILHYLEGELLYRELDRLRAREKCSLGGQEKTKDSLEVDRLMALSEGKFERALMALPRSKDASYKAARNKMHIVASRPSLSPAERLCGFEEAAHWLKRCGRERRILADLRAMDTWVRERIAFRNVQLGPQDLTFLAKAIAFDGALTVLDLSGSSICGSKGTLLSAVDELIRALERNATIKVLNLSNLRLQHEELALLAGFIASNNTLESLDLRDNRTRGRRKTSIESRGEEDTSSLLIHAVTQNSCLAVLNGIHLSKPEVDLSHRPGGLQGYEAFFIATRLPSSKVEQLDISDTALCGVDSTLHEIMDTSGLLAICDAVPRSRLQVLTVDRVPLPVKLLCDSTETTAAPEISLSALSLGCLDAIVIGRLLSHNRTTTALDLSRNDLAKGGALEGLKLLADAVKNERSALQSIDLSYNHIGELCEDGLVALSLAFMTSNLRTVRLAGDGLCYALRHRHDRVAAFDVSAFQVLCDALNVCGVTALDLSSNALCGPYPYHREEAVTVLRDTLPDLSLQELRISNNSLGPSRAAILLEPLQSTQMLKILDISRNSLGVDGAKVLASFVNSSLSLCELNISRNILCGVDERGSGRYDPSGTLLLCKALCTSSSLSVLDLSYNALAGQFGDTMVVINAMSHVLVTGRLVNLNLAGNFIGGYEVERSRKDQRGRVSCGEEVETPIGDQPQLPVSPGIAALMHAVPQSRLVSLDLSDNWICTEEAGFMLAVLSETQHPMQELKLRQNMISGMMKEHLLLNLSQIKFEF